MWGFLMPIADTLMPIHGEDDIVLSRQRARETAKQLGFAAVDQSRIATAVSELTRNVVRYATDGRGEVTIRELSPSSDGPGRVGIEIVVSDEGPGIPDVGQALRDGYTSGSGMGMGLPGTRRLMDEMSVDSAVGRGTVVTIRKWRR
jgi:serine/threonine-protein kinase RsbT